VHENDPLHPEDLLRRVWGDVNVGVDNVRGQIRSLRRKLGADPNGNGYIVTVQNKGYRLACAVRWTDEPVAVRSRIFGLGRIGAAMLLACVPMAWHYWPREAQVQSYRQITRDGRQKHGRLLTDGDRVYFNELADGRSIVSSVPVSGGPVSRLSLPIASAAALAISPQLKCLLVADLWSGRLFEVQLGTTLGLREIPMPSGSVPGEAAWDARFNRIAVSSRDMVTIFKPWTKLVATQRRLPGISSISSWDTESRFLRVVVMDKSGTTRWWDLSETGKTVRQLRRLSTNLTERYGVWTGDGRFFVFEAGVPTQTELWIASGGQDDRGTVRRLTFDARSWKSPAIVPGSNTVVAIGGQPQGQLVTLPSPEGHGAGKLLLPGVPAYELDYSRDRQLIAYTLFPDHSIWRCRRDGSDGKQLTPAGMEAHQPHWSPDGTRVAFTGKAAGKEARWRIYVAPGSGGALDEPLPEGEDQGVPTWSPDGRSLIFGDRMTPSGFEAAAIHELDLRTHRLTRLGAPASLWSPRMSPDGKHLGAVSYDSRVLYLRDNVRETWRACVTMNFVEEPSWPLDSSWIQFVGNERNGQRGLFRIGLDCRQPRRIVDLSPYSFAGDTWFGITPDGSPSGLVQMPDEIYALDWRMRRRIP
jgi:Tol biopolymer transport system component